MVRFQFHWCIYLFSVFFCRELPAQNSSDFPIEARIVLVVPQGSEPKEDYQERLESVALRTEKFFADWLDHWNRKPQRQEIFARNSNGTIQVTLVKVRLSSSPNGRQSLNELRNKSLQAAKKQLGHKKNSPATWWIFYDFPGVKGFRGGGNSKSGTAINAYPGGRGLIDKEVSLASRSINKTQLKGAIHEFGHALGLPHNGPRMELKLGNSLMGPITPKFQRKTNSKEERVYLNEASAAMIWKHPLFMDLRKRPIHPKIIKIKEFSIEESSKGKITITGQLESDLSAHSVVVFDGDGKFGEYWIRSHAGFLNESGKFAISFWSPYKKGKLFLSCCFDNGIVTSDGKKQKSFIEIPYSGVTGEREFVIPKVLRDE